jgi:hypothetical protein
VLITEVAGTPVNSVQVKRITLKFSYKSGFHICCEHVRCRMWQSQKQKCVCHRLRARWVPSQAVSRHWVPSHCVLLVQGATVCSTVRGQTTAATLQLCATTADAKWTRVLPCLALRCVIQCCTGPCHVFCVLKFSWVLEIGVAKCVSVVSISVQCQIYAVWCRHLSRELILWESYVFLKKQTQS